jgi:hypothetical protein
MGPEFLDHAVQDVEIGGIVGGARDVAVAKAQFSVGDEAGGHAGDSGIVGGAEA